MLGEVRKILTHVYFRKREQDIEIFHPRIPSQTYLQEIPNINEENDRENIEEIHRAIFEI